MESEMFANFLKVSALAALIATGVTAASTSQASAGQVQFGVTFGSPYYGHGPYWGPRPGYGPPRGICKHYRAINKARWYGVRNPHVVKRTPYRVVVRGWRHGYQSRVVFANRRACPVIRTR